MQSSCKPPVLVGKPQPWVFGTEVYSLCKEPANEELLPFNSSWFTETVNYKKYLTMLTRMEILNILNWIFNFNTHFWNLITDRIFFFFFKTFQCNFFPYTHCVLVNVITENTRTDNTVTNKSPASCPISKAVSACRCPSRPGKCGAKTRFARSGFLLLPDL